MRKMINSWSLTILITLLSLGAKAQLATMYHGYSEGNNWYIDTASFSHTTMQAPTEMSFKKDSNTFGKNWFTKALFKSSLFAASSDENYIEINFLPNLSIGSEGKQSNWNNTRAFQIRGQASEQLSFNLEVYENQSKFPAYLDSNIMSRQVIFGQTLSKGKNSNNVYDYQYAMGHIHYQKNQFGLTLANDKLFIGDGYRSLLLSDAAASYAYFKASYQYKKLHYSAIYMQHIDAYAPVISSTLGLQKKWGVIHYLDYSVNKKLNIGLFDAVVWQDADSFGKRGFDFLYANPVIFLRSLEYLTGSSDNAILGLNASYKVSGNTKLYGQIVLDECKVSEYLAGKGWWANKFGLQLGIKSSKVLGIKQLFGFSELNMVKPYTYSHWISTSSYAHLNESLAHPLGANFIEWVSRLEYAKKQWLFYVQVNYSVQGIDPKGAVNNNFGSNILLSYNTLVSEYGNYLLQGLKNTVWFINPRVSYCINPKINMRLQLEYIYRKQTNTQSSYNTSFFSFGLVTGFRNFYKDR